MKQYIKKVIKKLTGEIMKKYILLIFLVVLLMSCQNFFYGYTKGFYYVDDYYYWQDGVPSYQVNTNDRYCFYYTGNNSKFKTEKSNMEKINKQVTSFFKSKNIKIKEEIFVFEFINNGIKKNEIEKQIKQREKDNNFKNCDYLLKYELHNYNVNNPKLPLSDISIYI